MVKASIASERQCVSSTLESRIAALESANLLGLSRKRSEEDTGNDRKKESGIVKMIYNFDDVLKLSEKQFPVRDRCVSLLFKANGHSGLVSSLSFNPSGTFLASGCDNGILNIWAIQVINPQICLRITRECFKLKPQPQSNTLCFNYLTLGTLVV